MTQSQHTKGPWHRNIPPASKYPIIFAGRNTHIAQVLSSGLTKEEVEANCNLITAAPDLLRALHNLLENITFYEKVGIIDEKDYKADRANAIKTAKEAIKKAEGKE